MHVTPRTMLLHGEELSYIDSGDGPVVDDYSLSSHAATLRDLLDRLEIETVTLVGHSLGVSIAMQFLLPLSRAGRAPGPRGQCGSWP